MTQPSDLDLLMTHLGRKRRKEGKEVDGEPRERERETGQLMGAGRGERESG